MYFGLTDEQESLRETVRDFFASTSHLKEVRRLIDSESGHDETVWRTMAEQIGVQGLAIPEIFGGSGFSFFELAIVLEEAGYALYGGPLLGSTVLAAAALQTSGDVDVMALFLPGLADGSTIGALAVTEEDGSWDVAVATARAQRVGEEFRLTGTKSYVLDGQLADFLLVSARTEEGLSLFAVDGAARGLTRTAMPVLDLTRRMSTLSFDDTPARLVGVLGQAEDGLRRALQLAAIALGAEQAGGAQRCLEMSLGYAKTRVAFDRPIGGFQAIKHMCADMFTAVESARSAARYAAWCAAFMAAEVPLVSSLTKAHCSDSYFRVAADNIQVHGGIGFTWEHDAHLFFKRATSSGQYLGSAEYHRELLAQCIEL